MILGIVGTRDEVITYSEFKELVTSLTKDLEVTEIVSGGAKGIDSYAERLAKELGVTCTVFKPNYSKYGKAAPLVRNTSIVERAETVLAFPTKTSKGTYDSIRKAERRGKKLIVWYL